MTNHLTIFDQKSKTSKQKCSLLRFNTKYFKSKIKSPCLESLNFQPKRPEVRTAPRKKPVFNHEICFEYVSQVTFLIT